LIWVTVVLRFVFPPGPDATGWTLWSCNYDQWNGIQFALLSLMGVAVLVHVMLHWTWVCGVITGWLVKEKGGRRDDGSRTLWGVGLLIILLNLIGLAVAAAALMIQGPMN